MKRKVTLIPKSKTGKKVIDLYGEKCFVIDEDSESMTLEFPPVEGKAGTIFPGCYGLKKTIKRIDDPDFGVNWWSSVVIRYIACPNTLRSFDD